MRKLHEGLTCAAPQHQPFKEKPLATSASFSKGFPLVKASFAPKKVAPVYDARRLDSEASHTFKGLDV